MKLTHHVIISLGIGATLYLATRNSPLCASFVSSNVFIDLDHLVDYFNNEKDGFASILSRSCRRSSFTIMTRSFIDVPFDGFVFSIVNRLPILFFHSLFIML